MGRRLAALTAGGLLTVLVVSAVALQGAAGVQEARERQAALQEAQTLLLRLDARSSALEVDGLEALVRPQPRDTLDDLAGDVAESRALTEQLQALTLPGPVAEQVDDVAAAHEAHVDAIRGFVGSAVADQASARTRFEDVRAAGDRMDSSLGTGLRVVAERAAAQGAALEAAGGRVRTVVVATGLAGVAVLLALAVLVSRSITRLLAEAAHALDHAQDMLRDTLRSTAVNAREAARVGVDAVTVAQATNATVSRVGESSRAIGDVAEAITSIAERTNLLALNATIEAARAGAAGKGFAVVANEVKDLARETARATEDIGRRVEAIQADTTGAADAVDRLTAGVQRMTDFQTAIAGALEERTAATDPRGEPALPATPSEEILALLGACRC